jgi:hypothetical protein
MPSCRRTDNHCCAICSPSNLTARHGVRAATKCAQRPVAAALLSALAVHEHRRTVTPRERRAVMAQVADQLIGRALMHRYLAGGHGRSGAIRDLLRATYHDGRWWLSGRQLARATAAVIAPTAVIVRVKRRFMDRGEYF